MELKELVARYRELAGEAKGAVLLSELGLPKEELERDLSAYEEDYQIGRFLQLTHTPGAGEEYAINDFPYTHLVILPGIDELL